MKYRAWNAIVALQSGINLSGLTRSNIDLTVTNCTFDAFGYGAVMRGVKEGKCTIGSKNNGNIFSNCLESVWLYDVINIPVEVVDNRFNVSIGCYGLDFENSPFKYYVVETQMKCPVINVERNEFNISGPTGIRIMEGRRAKFPEENKPVMIQVKNNRFNLTDGSREGINLFNLKGAVIRNNRFNGSSIQGVWIRTRPTDGSVYNENGLLLGNNFSNTVFSTGTVFLDIYSRNWTIVGGNLGERVTDLGDNNIISGFNINESVEPFGQTIVDNLEEMRDALQDADHN